MKEIIELIIAFLVIMSVLVGFLLVTSTTGTTHLYYLPSSMVQAFAYDTEDLLSGVDIDDVESNPEYIFDGLYDQYPELHFRIKIEPLSITESGITYLNNSNGSYLDFIRGNKFKVCTPEPANVSILLIPNLRKGTSHLTPVNRSLGEINGCYSDTLGVGGHGHMLAIVSMKTSDTTYVAYRFFNPQFTLQTYFVFQGDGLKFLLSKDIPLKTSLGVHRVYLAILRNDGSLIYEEAYIDFSNYIEFGNYRYFTVYRDSSLSNILTNVDGELLAMAPTMPQKILGKGYNYDIVAIPFPNPEEGFPPIVYGDTPPEDFPISTYQYITYVNGIPVVVTVEVWRASA